MCSANHLLTRHHFAADDADDGGDEWLVFCCRLVLIA
jgi:hypothetical protein